MKNILKIAVLLALPLTGMAQKKFVLDGLAKETGVNKLYLFYVDENGKDVLDSTAVTKQRFQFKGNLSQPTRAFLTQKRNMMEAGEGDYIQLYLEPAKMKLELQGNGLKDYVLVGSKTDAEYKQLENDKSAINLAMEPLSKAYAAKNREFSMASRELEALEKKVQLLGEEAATIKEKFEPYQVQMGDKDMAFIKSHPNSVISPYLLMFRMNGISVAETEALFASFSDDVKASRFGKEISTSLDERRSGAVGKPAPVFTTTDIDGKPLSLADFKGKYILLDFWASWCVPCRKGNPHLISLYQQYKSKGFEIIGIADDDTKPEKWNKAVEQDEIGIWRHVLRGLKYDGKNFDKSQDVTEGYGVSSLPTKILIDPQGIIIGRYGGGSDGTDAELDAKLAEVLK